MKYIKKFEQEEKETLYNKIYNIMDNYLYLRDVRYTDDQEVDPESITDATNEIIKLLKNTDLDELKIIFDSEDLGLL